MAIKTDVIKHWHAFKNPLINDVLINMEKLESTQPPLTDEELEALQKLLDSFKTAKASSVNELEFIQFLNQLPAAYMLYLVHKLQTLNSELIMKVISYTQKHKAANPEVGKFFARNMVFEKSQLLGRIFSNQRMERVLKVL